METILGVLAMAMGVATFVIGMSSQALKQYREKRCGISIVFVGLGIGTFVVRIMYFAVSGAYWTIPPDVTGLAISAVIIFQYGRYERNWW
ncbi:MAG: hypothetical protein Q8Q37_01355 [bacterium]|nr:hypothetical protein [bacterium]